MEVKGHKNILVTGGTGFVGSHLVEALINQKNHVITTFQALNPRSYFLTQRLDQKVTMVPCDVSDFEKVFDLVTKFEIDTIFHLAAQPLVGVAYHNPKRTLETNILGTTNVLESGRLFPKVKAVIVASSDKAYGKHGKKQYTEEDALKGDHPYEVSKSAADLISYSYFKTYNVPVVTTRFGNIYGEGDLNFSRLIPGLMKAFINNETLDIRSNGKYVRDYLYVKDVVDGYFLLASKIEIIKGEAFNFGSDETLSVMEVIDKTEKILKKKLKYRILNTAQNEIPYQSLDYTKIKKSIGWKPNRTFSNTLSPILKWYERVLC